MKDMPLLLESPKAQELFGILYGKDEDTVKSQVRRYRHLLDNYRQHFPEDSGDVHLFSTPGRTEVGGNHTDHNAGRVLAAAVNCDTIAAACKTNDGRIVIYSEGYPDVFDVDLSSLDPVTGERETTASLIRGTAARFRELGYSIGGFHAYVTSTVARGSGLSSSASIEVLIGTILNALYNDNRIHPAILAQTGQYAENVYFGKPSGLMDQMACAIGGFITIDFKDSNKPEYRKLDFDLSAYGYSLLVVDTGGNHADLTHDYAEIPGEMKMIACALGKKVLRELTIEDVLDNIPLLREKAGDRAILRAMHFFMDNQRVVEQAKALEENRFADFLRLVRESGSSSWRLLQNCCTIQNPREQGVTLALALTENFISRLGEGACRVHGGGFAGTIQVYLPDTSVDEYCHLMEGVFGKKSVTVLKIRPYGTLYLNDMIE